MPHNPARAAKVSPVPVLAIALILSGAAYVVMSMNASPAPFGAALPETQPSIISEGVEYASADTRAGRIPPAWLDSLAPQPDGSPPLTFGYSSSRGGFSVRLPRGAEVTQLAHDQFLAEDLDAYVEIHHNQPLSEVLFSMPVRNNGERLTEFVARMRHEIKQLDGELNIDQPDTFDLPRYRFSVIDFSYPAEAADKAEDPSAGTRRHRIWYCGPLGERLLVVEFMVNGGRLTEGREQAQKIMRSFRPSTDLAMLMLEEDPGYGEWAGGNAAEEAKSSDGEQNRAGNPQTGQGSD